jgi:hypothetical protein
LSEIHSAAIDQLPTTSGVKVKVKLPVAVVSTSTFVTSPSGLTIITVTVVFGIEGVN